VKNLFPARLRNNIGNMRFNLQEVSGSLGDLGLFIPLVVALVSISGMDGGSILLFAGILNIITGVVFNQPVPVQPMKAIAAVAIAEGLMPGEIAAAGFATGVIVLFLGLTGLISVAERIIPRPVVRGIQLGVGLKLAAKGVTLALAAGWWAWDGRLVALAGAALVLLTYNRARFPSAVVLFAGGFLLMAINRPEVLTSLPLGWSGPVVTLPDWSEWQSGFMLGTLPQLPLTLLNSVIAVCALSADLFPGRGIKTRSMATSVGLMNIASCLFGAMPMCHGSGGLAGQHRFGARTGGSVVMLGAAKVVIALFFGTAVISVLAAYPASVLGILLVFSGLELTLPARDCTKKNAFIVATATACGIIAANTAVGFVLGLIASFFLIRTRHPAGGGDNGKTRLPK
jgi:MFS superfamily sulfate permease-like transporter